MKHNGSCNPYPSPSPNLKPVVYKVIKDNKYIRIRNNMMEQTIKITYKYYQGCFSESNACELF
jgi:hypothetical protein